MTVLVWILAVGIWAHVVYQVAVYRRRQRVLRGVLSAQSIGIEPSNSFVAPTMALDSFDEPAADDEGGPTS